MLVVMETAATAEQVDAVVRHLERLGLKALPIPGAHRTAIAVTGKDAAKDPLVVENFAGAPSSGVHQSVPSIRPVAGLRLLMVATHEDRCPKPVSTCSSPVTVRVLST